MNAPCVYPCPHVGSPDFLSGVALGTITLAVPLLRRPQDPCFLAKPPVRSRRGAATSGAGFPGTSQERGSQAPRLTDAGPAF